MSVSLYGSGNTVIQVVSSTLNTNFSSSSTSYITTGLTASITPQSTTSKILINYTFSGATTNSFQTQIYRNGSILSGASGTGTTYQASSLFIPQNSGSSGMYTVSSNYLDSPATTSSTTYAIYIKTDAGTFWFNTRSGSDFSGIATITLLEISGS